MKDGRLEIFAHFYVFKVKLFREFSSSSCSAERHVEKNVK